MSTELQTLAGQTQEKLEEPIGNGIFWDLNAEIYPAIVEGMNEAALITGDPEVRPTTPITLTPGGIGNGFPPFVYAMPPTSLLIVRIDSTAGTAISKVLACDLDRNVPGWEGQTGPAIKRWFPVGMGLFGVWPALTAPQQVMMTVLGFPVPVNSSLYPTTLSPFRDEYNDGFTEYAAHICRLKEGGVDFQESIPQFQSFQDKMVSLTKFAVRRGISRFTKLGRQTKINDVVVK